MPRAQPERLAGQKASCFPPYPTRFQENKKIEQRLVPKIIFTNIHGMKSSAFCGDSKGGEIEHFLLMVTLKIL